MRFTSLLLTRVSRGGSTPKCMAVPPVHCHPVCLSGSVEESEDEQGLAHVVEHVTFLGSKKREGLLGTGARSNAYTDFHHTVFHVHAPLHNVSTGQPMLPEVRAALHKRQLWMSCNKRPCLYTSVRRPAARRQALRRAVAVNFYHVHG